MTSRGSTWKATKPAGDAAERAVAAYFVGLGRRAFIGIGEGEADVMLQTPIEVKHDRQAAKTGNFAVEVAYRGQPSGLWASMACLWVFVYGDGEGLIVDRVELTRLVDTGDFVELPAGDGGLARVRLVPVEQVRALRSAKPIRLEVKP